MGFFEKNEFEGRQGGRVLVSTIEVKALYAEIFLDSTYDMKFKSKPVITPDKGDDRYVTIFVA